MSQLSPAVRRSLGSRSAAPRAFAGQLRRASTSSSPPHDAIASLGVSTRAVHLGNKTDELTGAVIQPLTLSATFRQEAPGKALPPGFIYARFGNPTRNSLEAVLASLERGHAAFATSSGMAAVGLVIQALGEGGHCLAIRGIYPGTEAMLIDIATDTQGWKTDFFPFENATDQEIYDAIQPDTKVLFLESPTNPLIVVSDIAAIVRVAKSHPAKPLVVVDNTFGSPYYTNPLAQGADVVINSTTKYIGGHSDVVGGVAVIREGLPELETRMRRIQRAFGAIASPFDSYLLTRSIKTLPLRALQHGLSALKIAAHLERHPLVEKVLYPGLKSHVHHGRVKEALADGVWKDLESRKGWEQDGVPFGGTLSFRPKGDAAAAEKFLLSSRLLTLAESLGGVESLAKLAWTTASPLSDEERIAGGMTRDLIRVSIGLEDVDDLIADIDQALEKAHA